MAPPTSPGFYPHSEWAAPGPVHVGVRSKPRPIIVVMDLGCWALPSNRRSLKDPPLMRSHPNKAVDVAFHQTSKKQPLLGGLRFALLAVIPMVHRIGYLGSNCLGCPRK
jgi:hypothetical protein